MCGRFTMLTADEIADVVARVQANLKTPHLRSEFALERGTRRQAFPGSVVQTIAPHDAQLEIIDAIWGIEAPWAKKADGKPKLVFNTRLDSALSGKSMWANPIAQGRCIIPAATFFEPHATELSTSPRTGKAIKRAYEFASEADEPLLLASVRADDRVSIVTTDPNRFVSPVHPRMPLVLNFEEVPLWLEGTMEDIAALADRSSITLEAYAETPLRTAPSKLEESQLSLF